MRKPLLAAFVTLLSVLQVKAEVSTYTFIFYESDFLLTYSGGDSLVINSCSEPAMYPSKTDPGIPILGRSIVLPETGVIKNYSVALSKRLIRENVDLKNAPVPIPTNVSSVDALNSSNGYALKVYPESNCIFSKCNQFGSITTADFLLSPFVFDAIDRNLYFVDSIQITYEIESSSIRKAPSLIHQNQLTFLESIVENKEMLVQMPMTVADVCDNEIIEYVIITSDALSSTFKPLAEWKTKKGVPSEIVTVEYIDENYPGETQQMRIKGYIKDMVEQHFTQYVLLGGDVDVVPSQPCYVDSRVGKDYVNINGNRIPVTFYVEEDIPADVYYSCLSDMDWDINGNGRYGEMGRDNVGLAQTIYLTRAPVRTESDVEAFVAKVIEYEKSPNFVRDFFQAGTIMDSQITGEKMADLLFDEVINRKIILGANKFFDTYTYSGQPFSEQTFSAELSKGYQFAEIISHGSPTRWVNYNSKMFFDTQLALSLNNNGHTLITTMACDTNAFDQEETDRNPNPCLGEALIRNPNSGVWGYLASSRLGWYNTSYLSLDFSMAYEKIFYERMLGYEQIKPDNKNFGAIVAHTKNSFLCYVDEDPIYRWLFFSINALGDPETPVYNTIPKSFGDVKAEYDDNGILSVKVGVDGARICVSRVIGNNYYAIEYGSECLFDTGSGIYDIWITKQNYIPKHIRASYLPNLNIEDKLPVKDLPKTEIVSISPNPATTYVDVKFTVALLNPDMKISLTEINSGRNYQFDITGCDGVATIDVSSIQNGVYVVNLIENGVLIQSTQRLIKQ